MIGWSAYLTSTIMVTKIFNVHYHERYVNVGNTLEIRGMRFKNVFDSEMTPSEPKPSSCPIGK